MPRYLTYPPELYTLLKLKNRYRWRYQRSRVPIYSHLHTLFSQAFNTQLSQLRNKKWSSILLTLHPQSSKLWKMTRYFKAPTSSSPPLYHNGTQIYKTLSKAELLARQFEQPHHLTLHMGSHNHSVTVTRHVHTFFRKTSLILPPPPQTLPTTTKYGARFHRSNNVQPR